MRMSCNGCRILRKACTDDCTIKPCLEWIRSPESQSNATVFLAKFYGRAGLLKLISAAPKNLRPAVFRSLMYEACGRIVNPVYGSVGLLWSGSWQLCQNAVEAVLQGNPIIPIASDAAETNHGPPFKAYDIRHITKNENSAGSSGVRRARTKAGVKRARPTTSGKGKEPLIVKEPWLGTILESSLQNEMSSHGSGLSHQSEVVEESMVSVETSPAKMKAEVIGKINLELTLGNKPVKRAKTKKEIVENTDAGDWLALRLGFPA